MSLSSSRQPTQPVSPAKSIGQNMRWQVLLALAGIALLALVLGYSTYSVTTVLVPDRGGVFREGVAGNPKYLNPLLCDATEVDMDLCGLLYRGLTRIDKDGRVVPDLASSWEINDGVSYTFHMKPDQYWHDGEPVTARDVVFTISVLQDPDVVSLPGLTSLWRSVEAEFIDDLTVRFTLSEPFTPFLDYTSIGLLPEHIWQGVPATELTTMPLNVTPIGNGPMRVVETAADHIRLEPSPYYRESHPYLSALELRFYPDHASLFPAFVNGDIDGIRQIYEADLPAAVERDDLQLFSSATSEFLSLALNMNNPDVPFLQEKEVRQALYYAIDRERLIEDVMNGQGIIAHSPMLPENWAYNPEVKKYAYDRNKASQMLDEAGWIDSNGDGIRDKDGKEMSLLLYSNDDPRRKLIVEQIAADWQAIGIDAQPTIVTFAGLVSDFLNPRRFDAALIGWELTGDPDPYPLWHSSQATGGGQNYSGWVSEDADQLIEEARGLVHEEDRIQLYHEFQDIFAEELPALVLFYPVYTYGVSDEVHNVQLDSLNQPSERFRTFSDWYMLTRRVPVNQVPATIPPTPPGQANGPP